MRVRGGANFDPSSQNSNRTSMLRRQIIRAFEKNALKYDIIILSLRAVCFQSEVRHS
jgi:hypothetical protein